MKTLSLGGRGDVDAERRRDDVGGGGVEGGGAEDDRSMRRDKAGKMSGQRKLVVNRCFFKRATRNNALSTPEASLYFS